MANRLKTMGYPSPFLKWAGGKGQLLDQYSAYFPEKFGRYFEPFIGGGAVFFHLKPVNALLSDSNQELINCYRQIKENPRELMELLEAHKQRYQENEKEYFYKIREQIHENLNDAEKAARTIFLNKTCYNGLYRLNSWGEFNVPIGKYKNPGIYDPENIRAVHELLKTTELRVMDYTEIRNYASAGDLVYLDPPYHPLNETSSFTGYTEASFSDEDQRKLALLYHDLDHRGCMVMLSNSNTKLINTLYSRYNLVKISANRAINSRADRRSAIHELMIMNFETKESHHRNVRKKTSKYWAPWESLFNKHVDKKLSINPVSSKDIKKETGMEPRLMAKFDTREDLPPIFRENGMFLLPVSNGEYVIIRGEGFHDPETCDKPVEDFTCELPFELKSSEYGSSEMQYVDYAFNSGLISHFTGIETLYPTIRGRKRSKDFSFRVEGTEMLEVSSVQVEIDSGYEGENEIIIMEAKVGAPTSFNIRQLYYPYRSWGEIIPDKKIRPIFFTYDPIERIYSLYEYRFIDKENYNSITPVAAGRYRISYNGREKDLLGYFLQKTKEQKISENRLHIPQANDVEKIIGVVFQVAEGLNNAGDIAEQFELTHRQGNYYLDAGYSLGLLEKTKGRKTTYQLTARGKRFVTLPVHKRNSQLCRLMMEMPIVKEVMTKLYEKKSLSMKEMSGIIEENSSLTGNTPRRRAGTLRSWFWWLYAAVGVVKVGRGRVFI